MNKYFLCSVLALSISFLTAIAEAQKFDYVRLEGEAQGTTYHITYENTVGRNLKHEVDSILRNFDYSLSTYNPHSIISKINSNDSSVKPDLYFMNVFVKSYEIYLATNGAFDITVGKLIRAYGFGPDKKTKIDQHIVDSLLQYTGLHKVKMVNGRIIKSNPNITLDVNAIAQGYSVDVISQWIESLGIRNYLVEIGGELYAKGVSPRGEKWNIGIDKPVEGNDTPGNSLQAVLQLSGKAVSTSGNYRKFKNMNGKKFTHIINPHTGLPTAQNLLSVTIVADNCTIADAYCTACMVFGLEKSIEFLKKHPELQAFLIYADEKGRFRTYSTSGLKNDIKQ